MRASILYLSIFFVFSTQAGFLNTTKQKLSIGKRFCAHYLYKLVYGNPYKKKWPIKSLNRDQAIKLFNEDLDSRVKNLKEESMPFLLLQEKLDAPTVILLHGMSDSPASVLEMSKVYFEKGYNVVAPLYRDHGIEGGKQVTAMEKISLDHWRKDVDQAIAIAKGLGPEVSIGGYSLGGGLAVDANIRHPELFNHMLLFAPLFKAKNDLAGTFSAILRYFKIIRYIEKEVDEEGHFYKKMHVNLIHQGRRMTIEFSQHLKKKIINIPIKVFLTDADYTIDNFTVGTFSKVNRIKQHTHIYKNKTDKVVLHRDLTMPTLNDDGSKNGAIPEGKKIISKFLDNL